MLIPLRVKLQFFICAFFNITCPIYAFVCNMNFYITKVGDGERSTNSKLYKSGAGILLCREDSKETAGVGRGVPAACPCPRSEVWLLLRVYPSLLVLHSGGLWP